MAFNEDWTVEQGIDSSSFTLVDASTGSDGNLIDRIINLRKADGTLLAGPVTWALADATYIFNNILPKDYSLLINVTARSSSPLSPPSEYTKQQIVTFVEYSMDFSYGLAQRVGGNPSILNDKDFLSNWFNLQTWLNGAILCTNYSDQAGAQLMLDKIFNMIQKESKYF